MTLANNKLMSKITCKCGHLINDQTDFIPYKGYVVPDMDCEKVNSYSTLMNFSKEIFECEKCGRILIERFHGTFAFFKPDEESTKGILRDQE